MVIIYMISMLLILIGNSYIEGCTDQSVSCKEWSASGYCESYKVYMSKNCRLSCNLCQGCTDTISYCSLYAPYCNDPRYKDVLIRYCTDTCDSCHITTQPTPTTAYVSTLPYTGSGGRAIQPGCGKKRPSHTRIVGGTNAKPGYWPWQVRVQYHNKTSNKGGECAGTLIDEEWVLSAAHCFYHKNEDNYRLTLGEHDINTTSNWEQIYNITEIILHPKYNPNSFDHDLALLRLNRNVSFNHRVGTACLPGQNTSFPNGTKCYMTGWGLLKENGTRAAILQQVQVPLVARKTCQAAYAHFGLKITSSMLCAGHPNGKIDSCQGDSGGPLVCNVYDYTIGEDIWYLWGTISWGVGCARKALYGVLASPKVMRPWIDSIVFKGKV